DNKLMDALIDLLDADIPEVMYDKKVDENVRDFSYRLQSNGMNLDDYFTYTGLDMESFRGQFREQAIRQVKLRLALEKIAELEAVAVSDEDVETEYANLAKNYDIPVDQVKTIVPVEGLRLDVAVEKAVDVVRDSANYVAPSAE
ncbi:MAG: trigger factor, partial [Clostridia bacterium]|nr:trigger factor [Clostridia bacterium]